LTAELQPNKKTVGGRGLVTERNGNYQPRVRADFDSVFLGAICAYSESNDTLKLVNVLGIVNITVAVIAVTLSLIALSSSRRQQRFDAILRVEEFLLQEDVVHGRRLLYESSQRGKLPKNREDIHTMVRAITRFDSAAILVKNGLVPKRWMLETWHPALQKLHTGIQLLIDYQRRNWDAGNTWPTLTKLIEEARRFECQEACCRSDLEEAETRQKNG
jgi:hypothetical protein